MIGIKTAIFFFAVLTALSFLLLKGPARYLCLIVIAGLAAKSVIHYYRGRIG
jgi:hypothetical protein